jgi:hypothetical protein
MMYEAWTLLAGALAAVGVRPTPPSLIAFALRFVKTKRLYYVEMMVEARKRNALE